MALEINFFGYERLLRLEVPRKVLMSQGKGNSMSHSYLTARVSDCRHPGPEEEYTGGSQRRQDPDAGRGFARDRILLAA